MKRISVLLSAVLLTFAAPVIAAGESAVQVLRVPADFSTIQDAVNAAAPGDIISVAPGTYCERVSIATAGVRLRAAPSAGSARAILSGAGCGTGGFGIHVAGVSGVEISGFTIEGFDSGIVLHGATESLVFNNEVRENVYSGLPAVPAWARAQGIVLNGASFNDVKENWIHDNGHLGIGLLNGSNSNLIRGNWLIDNQAQQSTYANFACSLMLWGTTNSGNQIVENEVTGSAGYGIMIGGGIQTGNLLAQNRVHGHPWEGIVVRAGSSANVIQQNDARGNGLDGYADMSDSNTTNLWQRNLGTCEPGNAACG